MVQAKKRRFRRVEGLEASIELLALGVALPLADMFEGTTAVRG